jgi:hypothetical protein
VGYAPLEIEEAVGVDVDLVLRRRGEAHEQRVEVAEDRAVLLIDRAVRFVDDDEVEVAGAEAALPVPRLIDEPHHRRIGGDEDAPLAIPLGDEVHGRRIGQMRLEGVDRLVDQRHAVREKQHALGPVALHEQVAERDDRARLAGARGHDNKRFPVVRASQKLTWNSSRTAESASNC